MPNLKADLLHSSLDPDWPLSHLPLQGAHWRRPASRGQQWDRLLFSHPAYVKNRGKVACPLATLRVTRTAPRLAHVVRDAKRVPNQRLHRTAAIQPPVAPRLPVIREAASRSKSNPFNLSRPFMGRKIMAGPEHGSRMVPLTSGLVAVGLALGLVWLFGGHWIAWLCSGPLLFWAVSSLRIAIFGSQELIDQMTMSRSGLSREARGEWRRLIGLGSHAPDADDPFGGFDEPPPDLVDETGTFKPRAQMTPDEQRRADEYWRRQTERLRRMTGSVNQKAPFSSCPVCGGQLQYLSDAGAWACREWPKCEFMAVE